MGQEGCGKDFAQQGEQGFGNVPGVGQAEQEDHQCRTSSGGGGDESWGEERGVPQRMGGESGEHEGGYGMNRHPQEDGEEDPQFVEEGVVGR